MQTWSSCLWPWSLLSSASVPETVTSHQHFKRSPGDSQENHCLQEITTDSASCLIAFLSLLSLSCLIFPVILHLGSSSWFSAAVMASESPLFLKPVFTQAVLGSSLFHASEPHAILAPYPVPLCRTVALVSFCPLKWGRQLDSKDQGQRIKLLNNRVRNSGQRVWAERD